MGLGRASQRTRRRGQRGGRAHGPAGEDPGAAVSRLEDQGRTRQFLGAEDAAPHAADAAAATARALDPAAAVTITHAVAGLAGPLSHQGAISHAIVLEACGPAGGWGERGVSDREPRPHPAEGALEGGPLAFSSNATSWGATAQHGGGSRRRCFHGSRSQRTCRRSVRRSPALPAAVGGPGRCGGLGA